MKNLRFSILLSTLLLFGCSAIASETNVYRDHAGDTAKADKHEFCGDYNWSSGDKVSAKDLREINIAAPDVLTVDGRENGGISVKGEDRIDVLIKACVRSWGISQSEANSAVKNTKIETGSVVIAVNADKNAKYSVSYEISVPKRTNLKLSAHNGGIGVSSVQGTTEFETYNGGVSLNDVGGTVKGSTKNGGVSVKLLGSRFNGSGLDVETTNGGVSLLLPSNFSADVETGTVNGGLSSDFKELQVEQKGNRWERNKKISASINGGGPKIRVVTTNGGVKIKSSE